MLAESSPFRLEISSGGDYTLHSSNKKIIINLPSPSERTRLSNKSITTVFLYATEKDEIQTSKELVKYSLDLLWAENSIKQHAPQYKGEFFNEGEVVIGLEYRIPTKKKDDLLAIIETFSFVS